MITSNIANNWIEKNKYLLFDDQIKKEIKIIKAIQKK